jgi:gliding motility-associated-like protein
LKYCLILLFWILTASVFSQPYCENFDNITVPNADKAHAFNIYGNGNAGFLSRWFVPSGTPSIYASGDLPGVNAYNGNQYALAGVCDVSQSFADGLVVQFNFVPNHSYNISFAARNAPSGSPQPTPIDIDYILLQNNIPYTYNPNTGCSSTPPIPGGSMTVNTTTNFAQNSWQTISFNTGNVTSNYSYLWIRPKFSAGSPLITTLLLIDSFCIAENVQSYCNSFEGTAVPASDKNHAFNIYGNGNSGFLQDWFIPSGTPSIYATGDFPGMSAYDGNQYALQAICDVGQSWSEGLMLQFNYTQGQSYDVSFAIRNMPQVPNPPTPIDVDYILLPSIIPYTYNASTGCSPTPAIPSGALTVHTLSNFALDAWQIMSFNTGILSANYSYLWIRPKFSAASPLITTFFCSDSACIKPNACNLALALGNDTSLCTGQNLLIDATTPNSTYSWQDGSTNAIYNVVSAGLYSVTISDNSGCTATDAIDVSYSSGPPSIDLGTDTTYCGSFNCVLSTGNANTLWSSGISAQQISASAAGIYWAEISNGCGLTRDTVIIAQINRPLIDLGNPASICNGDSVLLQPAINAANFIWSTGASTTSIYASQRGIYWMEVWDTITCRNRDSVLVSGGTAPLFTLGNDTSVCNREGLRLKVAVPNVHYQWQDNSTDSIYYALASGTYSVTITNSCGSASDAIKVEVHVDECELAVPTGFTPNGDGVNDLFRGITKCPTSQYNMHVFNRWGEQVFETKNVSDGWDGSFRGVRQPMDVFVYYIQYFNLCEDKLKTITGNVSLLR